MVVGKPLFTVSMIQDKVKELADRISRDYEGKDLVVVSILRGAFMFTSDLIRSIRTPLTVDFVNVSSYIGTETSEEVKLHCDIREDIKGKHVLLVEDIVDTGTTLNYLKERFLQREPKSIRICCLLNKKERRLVDVPLDYVGFEIPNLFVVGYGLDYNDHFRNLPYIAVFRKST